MPIEPNHKLGDNNNDASVDQGNYQRLVGQLIYLLHTKPNISNVVSVVSQFMHNPKEEHLQTVHRILHNLKGTPEKEILFKKGTSLTLEAYTDVDYTGFMVDRCSTLGYCTFLGGTLVTWRSKKQNAIAKSSVEAKLRAMALGICE
ncbi:Retrovirus-related Pol polyprotein from transposon RE1 [Vitis vinifera]|uniref:Retrovirus-related Pol polyprotein from transposon RE1 n=1 Tax=Vitis vinifera TaxID=29760 RepID=A0A438EB36_VITVI|nr:Retrovirus-related Pol polyprotein from transposon RE1 [Vitis vinifera]